MFATAQILNLKRTAGIRAALCLLLLPVVPLCFWLASIFWKEDHDASMTAILAAVGLVAGGVFWFFFERERSRAVRLYEDGVEQVLGGRTTELRWDQVTEIWFRAIKFQAGGLIGILASAAAEAAAKRKGKPFDGKGTSINVRLVGPGGEKIVMTSNDKEIVKAFETASARVNPRLLENVLRRVQNGDSVAFGKISISARGIALGAKDPIPFAEVEKFHIAGGVLRLKKRGSWLDAIAVPLAKIPNVFVLTEAYLRLAAPSVDPEALRFGRHVAGRMMM